MDTAGQEDFKSLRVLGHKNTNCFIVCFSVVDMVTFKNVTASWLPEIQAFAPEAKILFVGTKSDLRGQNSSTGRRARMRASLKKTSLRDKEAILFIHF
jgi:small GTP-binding protein